MSPQSPPGVATTQPPGSPPASPAGSPPGWPPASPPGSPPALTGLAPIHDRRARLLILGSFPGIASLQAGQYYAHPRNLFWPMLADLTGEDLAALTYRQRLVRVRHHGIAIWDVIGQCFRRGSLDGAIREPVGQDFETFLAGLPALKAVAFNGGLAAKGEPWFRSRGYRTYRLPSTSPAHAALSSDRKRDAWRVLKGELDRSISPPTRAARRPGPD